MREQLSAHDHAAAGLIANPLLADLMKASGRFKVECVRDGKVIWVEEVSNLITDVAKNHILDTVLAGSAFTAANYMFLKGAGSAAAGDTMASHAGWSELTGYNEASRPTCAWSAASGKSKALSSALTFTINATLTVAGIAIVTGSGASATKSNTGGVLFCATDFSASRSVVSGDVINVSYTASIA